MRIFNEIFRKDVNYDELDKPQVEVKLASPSLFRINQYSQYLTLFRMGGAKKPLPSLPVFPLYFYKRRN